MSHAISFPCVHRRGFARRRRAGPRRRTAFRQRGVQVSTRKAAIGRTRAASVLLLSVVLCGCQHAPPAVPRYIVSTAPLTLLAGHPGFCVAVDPSDEKGVWWWEPGQSGCSSRSTGPGVFPAQSAAVARSATGAVAVSFEIQLMKSSPLVVRLTLRDDAMLEERTGMRVQTERKPSTDLPEMPPPARRATR